MCDAAARLVFSPCETDLLDQGEILYRLPGPITTKGQH